MYFGSLGGWYALEPDDGAVRGRARQIAEAHVLFLSQSERDRVNDAAIRAGLPAGSWIVAGARYQRVPEYLRGAHAGVALIHPSPPRRASSPTKVAEYLACGLPVVVNTGIGDLADFVEQEGVGVVLHAFEESEYDRAAEWLVRSLSDAALAARCTEVAARRFDLDEVGIRRYETLYRDLGADPGGAR